MQRGAGLFWAPLSDPLPCAGTFGIVAMVETFPALANEAGLTGSKAFLGRDLEIKSGKDELSGVRHPGASDVLAHVQAKCRSHRVQREMRQDNFDSGTDGH